MVRAGLSGGVSWACRQASGIFSRKGYETRLLMERTGPAHPLTSVGGARLRVLSYNIHRAIGVDRRFRLDRIATILEHHDADVVLLQEVDQGAPRSQELDLAEQLAKALAYPFHAVGHNVELRKGRYGNATLSRFPILSQRNIDLTIGKRKRRGCQHASLVLTVNGHADADQAQVHGTGQNNGHGGNNAHGANHGHEFWQLEVFNLHLGLSAREREQQVQALIQSQEFARIGEETPCLIGGDFNDWRSLVRPILTDEYNFSSATELPHPRHGRQLPLRTYPSFSPQGALDRIYFRGPLSLRSAQCCPLSLSKRASDHLPIIAEFEIV